MWRRLSDNTTVCRTPWFTQWQNVVFIQPGPGCVRPVMCHYLFPATDDVDLLVAGLGPLPQWIFELLSGPDFGDELTRQVAMRWPLIFDYFLASTEQRMDRRFLMIFKTMTGVGWGLVEPLRDGRRIDVPLYLREDLMMAALATALRMSAPWETLPEFVETLGGPGRVERRLRGVSGLLGSLSAAGGALSADGDLQSLIDLAKSLGELPQQFREVRD